MLAPFATRFAAADFRFGAWQGGERRDGVIQAGYFALSPAASAFVAAAYEGEWVRPEVNWSEWAASDAYLRLRADPQAVAGASLDEIACLLATLIRGDRFNEGLLAAAYDDGLLSRILARIVVLAQAPRAG